MKGKIRQQVFHTKEGDGHASLADPADVPGLQDEIDQDVAEAERQRFIHDATDSEDSDDDDEYNVKSHHGRIGYKIEDEYVTAYVTKDGTQVGQLEMGDDGFLNHIGVIEDYRFRGIGSKLIELAIEHCGLSFISYAQETDDDDYSLTPDGEALIASCLKKGIVTPDMCYLSDDAQYPSLKISLLVSGKAGTKKKMTFSDYGMLGGGSDDGADDSYQSNPPSPM